MSGLIEEIQRSCLNDSVPIESLLRRVKLAAVKLELESLESWVDCELTGYNDGVPDHRKLRGEPAAWNPYNGWIPMQFGNAKMADILSTAHVAQPIAGLRDLIAKSGDGGVFHFPLSPNIVNQLNEMSDFQTARMVIQVPRGGIIGILDAVRNKVLDWTIEMERNGVVGHGLTFDAAERQNARSVMNTFNIGNIDNFAGNMGSDNVSGDNTINSAQTSEVIKVMQKLRASSTELVAAGADASLPETIDAVIVEAEKVEPDAGRLRTLSQDVRAALAGAAGNLTAEGAMAGVAAVLRILGGG